MNIERLYTMFNFSYLFNSHPRKNKTLTLGPHDTIKEMIN